MIIILSPAKTINMQNKSSSLQYSIPKFNEKAAGIMKKLKKMPPIELEGLMKINPQLAESTFAKNAAWQKEVNELNSKQAILAYDGAVYRGLSAESLGTDKLQFAQQHLRILSGLYGVLRPLDAIQPHRLEMGIKFKTNNWDNLHMLWKPLITSYFEKELENHKEKALVNLASKEYYSVIDMDKLNCSVVTPIFKEYKNGKLKVITIYAKRARGLMARFIIENNIDSIEPLKEFDMEGYRYQEMNSKNGEMLFAR